MNHLKYKNMNSESRNIYLITTYHLAFHKVKLEAIVLPEELRNNINLLVATWAHANMKLPKIKRLYEHYQVVNLVNSICTIHVMEQGETQDDFSGLIELNTTRHSKLNGNAVFNYIKELNNQK